MKHSRLMKFVAVAGLLALPLLAQAQLMKGKLVGIQGEDVAVAYSPDGYLLNQQVTEVKVAADGTFTYDRALEQPADVEIYVGEAGIFGAHLEKGKTLEVTITKNGREMDATFKGPHAEISRFVNLSSRAFDSMKYSSMDPSASRPNAEYRALLEENYGKVKAALKKIKNKEQRDFYTRLSEGNYKWTKARLIMDDCEDKHVSTKDNAEMQELLKGIDVNDPVNYRTNMSLTALNHMCKAEFGGSNEQMCNELMDIVNKNVTLPALRNVMVRIIGQNYYIYGDGSGDYEAFTKRFKEFAGADAPVDMPDGKQVQLKDICKGKFTYIDVWATWCGPCKKEIPFMEKLVERFKGNDKVQFVSISVDENVEAWKKMIAADKPQWAQYNINGEANKQFSADWGITGIPRFIMIDKNGNIFAADATRPSNEETAKTIDEQTR